MKSETTDVRRGEEIDAAALKVYCGSHGIHGDLVVSQFPAGSSNLTYLVRAGSEEFVLRRPPFGNTVKTAHDMRREFDVLSKLSEVYPAAPKPVLFCEDASVIGSEFYLMQRRRGLIIRGRTDGLTELDAKNVCGSFIKQLAELHSIDFAAAGLGDLGRPEGYNERQVEGWSDRYHAAKTHEWRQLEQAIVWLSENVPQESGAALIHNDYKFDNVMLDPADPTRVVAVLDWEMVTVGDPLMDLGTTLGYWMSPDVDDEMLSMPFNPRVLMENVTRTELVEMYSEASARELPDMLFYYVFGTFKIAVIAQQIYARWVKGFTTDERFAGFGRFVAALGSIAAKAIDRGSI